MNDDIPLTSSNCDLFCFVLLTCLAGREATGSQNLLKMRIQLGSRRGCLKFHKTYECVSAEGSGKVSFIFQWYQVLFLGLGLGEYIIIISVKNVI